MSEQCRIRRREMAIYLLILLSLLMLSCKTQSQEKKTLQNTDTENLTHLLDSITQKYHAYVAKSQQELAKTQRELVKMKAMQPLVFDSLIRIRLLNLINGYQVTAIWQPEYVGYAGKIIGKAIINFRKGKIHFSMVHSHYFINGELGETDFDSIDFDKYCIYEIEYPSTNSKQYLRNDVPFFFVDNGRKLVFTMWGDGQRRSHAYRFYQMEDDGDCLQDDLYQITNQEPYNQIDELSIFNDNEIVIHQEGGAIYHTEKIYRRDSCMDNFYKLDHIKDYVDDSVYIYKLIKTESHSKKCTK